MAVKTVFERIIDREIPAEILMETGDAIVINDINPQAPIHVLVIAKRRIERISSATDEDAEAIAAIILAAVNFAREKNIASYRLVVNSGILAGETVPHLHILLSGREMKWPPG
jgi:histidine triad (HIT) family protein